MPEECTVLHAVWRRFCRHRLAVASLALLLVLSVAAVLAPGAGGGYRYIPIGHIATEAKQPPSWRHPFGTDELGRDELLRTISGARISLAVGFAAATVAALLGTGLGALSGWVGGTIDDVVQRFTEVVAGIPFFPLLLAVSALGRFGISTVVLLAGLLGWPGTCRLVRGQVLAVRELDFVQAAVALGASPLRLVWRHVLPAVLPLVAVDTTQNMAAYIGAEAALSYFGLGAPPAVPTWGNLLSGAQEYLYSAPWLAWFPGLLLVMTSVAMNFVGDGVADALSPWQPKS